MSGSTPAFATSNLRSWPSAIGWPIRAPRLLVRQAHDKCQRDIQSRDVLVVEMADLSPDSLPPNGDGLVGHHLRPHSQSVLLGRIDRHPKIRRIVALGSHWLPGFRTPNPHDLGFAYWRGHAVWPGVGLHGGGGFLITCFGDAGRFTTGFLILPLGVSANAGAMIVNAAASRAIFLNMTRVSMHFNVQDPGSEKPLPSGSRKAIGRTLTRSGGRPLMPRIRASGLCIKRFGEAQTTALRWGRRHRRFSPQHGQLLAQMKP